MYLATFKCGSVCFDIFNTDRILYPNTGNAYYVTPHKLDKIINWCSKNNIVKKLKEEDALDLIEMKLIGTYNNGKNS